MRALLRPMVRAPLVLPQIRLKGVGPKHVRSDGNLGGPGGQQPAPASPGGPESIKQSWMPIAAAIGVVAGGIWIMLPSRGRRSERA
ncbi:hypothetical protein FHETE_3010 [Fusarium heterosporum]|uniref:Uncharacterized protein n=1 Tax=Fusarium heterosporum TaxID=42747 RepID=A0A8H5WSU1_FUSHE|nr:hypothetical protein FHETE_3010 [Fusarium heterosporum]